MPDERLTYDEFAAEFALRAKDGAYNGLYDRPSVLEALGDVAGLHVLDLGCGPGLYAAELVARGAAVHGVDSSMNMIALARESVPQATFEVHDLNRPMPWLGDATFDAALLALVIHHLNDRVQVLHETFRVLRPGGTLVVSTHHPTTDWLRLGGSYFDIEQVTEVWQDKLEVTYWRQPLQATCDEFSSAGFSIERIVEPLPVPEMAERFPGDYAKLLERPAFIVFELRRP